MLMDKVEPVWMKNYAPGYMGFTYQSTSILSKGISFFTRWERMSDIRVSHSFVVQDKDTVIQAHAGSGVAIASITLMFNDPFTQVFFRKPREWNPDIGHRIVAVAESHIGEKYDLDLIAVHAIAGTALGRLLKVPEKLYDFFDSPEKWICSELCAHCMDLQPEYKDKGVLSMAECAIDPQDLFEDNVIFADWKNEGV